MDPDTSPPDAKPPLINYIISFLLVGVAWGFTTPFIRRAAADFNARQEAKQPTTRPLHELIRNEHEQSGDETELAPREGSGSDSDEESEAEAEPEVESESESEGGDRPENVQTNTAPKPAWMNPQQGGGGWLRTKVVTLFWTIINLLRTPAYLVPLVINLTGSVWFFLLVGKHELSLTVPLANSSAFLFTVLGEWYVERKVIAKETWLGMILVLGGIGICVTAKS